MIQSKSMFFNKGAGLPILTDYVKNIALTEFTAIFVKPTFGEQDIVVTMRVWRMCRSVHACMPPSIHPSLSGS